VRGSLLPIVATIISSSAAAFRLLLLLHASGTGNTSILGGIIERTLWVNLISEPWSVLRLAQIQLRHRTRTRCCCMSVLVPRMFVFLKLFLVQVCIVVCTTVDDLSIKVLPMQHVFTVHPPLTRFLTSPRPVLLALALICIGD
jgi:hypothetical protein